MKSPLLVAFCTFLLCACSAITTVSSPQKNVTVDIRTFAPQTIPFSEEFSTTTFGNYEFRAQAPGYEPLYGLIPLKFNGGYLAVDILFFAPAAFFNLREVYPFYEFDLEKRVVRYKRKEKDAWTTYYPPQPEIIRAQNALGFLPTVNATKAPGSN